ncbi:TcdA/TcdB pore forming domain-containing protein [Lentinula aciculospora]|uniref:TcdA/TcdB pore forming domain-containing protein n=1 Tax=Lentinula aciculospora TaxID=153920 RepID=A0A9W9A4K2_9AGAR|nr:TcdA/TcdB pore forming domain-containing protein [Lentinula aciculospora]
MSDSGNPAIHDFAEDPWTFLTPPGDGSGPNATAVSSYNMFPSSLTSVPNQGYFQFLLDYEDKTRRTFEIKYHGAEEGTNTVWAYILGYNGGANRSRRPAFIDIPKNVPENTFLFTGSLTGCSVIVTNLDEDTYRVFHDSRWDSSLLYDNVEMAIDYSGYVIPDPSLDYNLKPTSDGGAACVFMQYRQGKWNMFVQKQTLASIRIDTITQKTVVVPRRTEIYLGLETGYFPIIVSQPGSYNAEHVRASFDTRRATNQKQLRRLAAEALPITNVPDVPDGDFEPFEGTKIDLKNPAVSHSEAIRTVINQAQGVIKGRLVAAQQGEVVLDVLKLQETNLKTLVEPTLGLSKDFDYLYLWIKQKEARGLDAVVITDGRLEAPLGSTAGERFTGQQLDALRANNEDFTAGYNGFDSVEIPGFASDMTSLEMTMLFEMSTKLTQTEMGALVHQISLASEREFRESVWQQTERIVGMFQDAGGSTKPMPQDFILNAVPDEYGGRCYPLVRAMSVALAQSDFAVDQLGIKLVALSPSSNADSMNAEIFRQCLKDLHASYPAAEASTLVGKTNLQDAVTRLSAEEGSSTIFALNTNIHAMLLGATNRGGTISYHFYDPNFTIATFSSQQELVDATTKFFVELGFADVYGADGSSTDPVFTLVQLDTDKMGRIGFDFNLNVADFPASETLTETIDIRAATELYLPDPARFTENRALSSGASLLEASELAEAWRDATAKLEASTGLGEHWMPILETLEDVDSGGYRVQFVNLEDLAETRWVSTEDPEIKDFKAYLDERLKALNEAYEFEGGTFVQKEDVTSAEAIDGLNAMFVVKTLIEHYNSRKDIFEPNADTNTNLAMALKVQSYLNLTQLGQQSLGDVVKIVELTQTIIRSEQAAQSSLSTVVRAFGRISEGAGFLLGGANVVFDAYELANAQNEIQKAVYGTQLAFDSASVLASAGSVGAGMLGASSAAAVLGGVSVILGGLAFGFGALASAFGKVAEDAQAVGRYFGDTEAAYKAGGYKYDEEHKILVPLIGAVITELNVTGDVQFDSQYIYRTHHGSTGSGYINYFFWIGDFPRMVRDKSQAINIREGIGAPAGGTLANTAEYTTIILPATPKSYISYEYMILPFATTRHDYGFDIIRRLEVDRRFDYDFYIFPSEYLIRRISHEYVETLVTVQLDGRSVRVQAPSLPDNMHNILKYTLQGTGADYTIGLMAGVAITLSCTDGTRWILDCRDLANDTITVGNDAVSVGGLQVTVANQAFSTILAITKNAEILQVDFDNHNTFPVEEDVSKFPGGSEKILAYLNDLNDRHLLRGMFITVENYTTPLGQAVGRAFYDITNKRLLYTVDAPTELTEDVQFGAETSTDEVYFYNTEHPGIWRVDAVTGTCLAKYNALCPSPDRTLLRVWQEDDHAHAVFRHQLGEDQFGELTYVLEANRMRLVSMVGDSDLLHALNQLPKWVSSTDRLLKAYIDVDNPEIPSPTDPLTGASIEADVDSYMLSVFGQDDNQVAYRFWIRFTDGAIIKPNFPPPVDIVLAGVVIPPMGSVEEFCFYSLEEQRIMIQTGTGIQTSAPLPVTIPREFGKLSNVFCVNNELFVITLSGYILRLTSQRELFLEAVNRQWFTQFETGEHDPWWTVLKSFAESHGATTVAILGLHAANHAVPAWFCNGKIVLTSSHLREQQLQITGLANEGGEAWLCHWKTENSGQLYSQPLVPDEQLATVLSPSSPDVISEQIPEGTKVLEPYPFKTVIMTNNGLQYSTTDGVTLIIMDKDTITLYGVDKDWQQNHLENLEADLDELAKQWEHGEVIVMQGVIPTTTPAWYLIPAGKLVVVTDNTITWRDNPLWLGTDINGTTGYFYLVARGTIYTIEVGKPARLRQYISMAIRSNDLLVLIPRPGEFCASLALWNVRYAMVAQRDGSQGTIYFLQQPSWAYYNANIVEWKNSGMVQIQVAFEDPETLLAKKIGEDLVIFDVSANNRSLTIRKAFGDDPAYANVVIQFNKLEFTSANVRSAQAWLQGIAKLDFLPDVTLKTIGHYLQNPES